MTEYFTQKLQKREFSIDKTYKINFNVYRTSYRSQPEGIERHTFLISFDDTILRNDTVDFSFLNMLWQNTVCCLQQ